MRRALLGCWLACAAIGSVAQATLVPCQDGADRPEIARALRRIRTGVDPCGESSQIAAVLRELRRCRRAAYRICVDRTAVRNLFDRPTAAQPVGTITWNPTLRTELAPGRTVRDPAASLLHELVHAAHDCAGLDAGALELEAVRLENVYRRAAGLAQRPGYGDEPLPFATVAVAGAACARRPVAPHEDLPPAVGEVAAPTAADSPNDERR